MNHNNMNKNTFLVHAGRTPEQHRGAVNPPVYHTSTILFENYADCQAALAGKRGSPSYARYGTETREALAEPLRQMEGAAYTVITSSGLSAVVVALMSGLKAGDHLLLPDSVYGSAREFATKELSRFGVETTYYDPQIGAGIASLMRPNTAVVYLESPGSLTFEMQDIGAIVEIAKKAGALTMMDNTWATPLYFQPLAHGIDVSIHSATKYIAGHSDLMMGVVSANERHAVALKRTYQLLAPCPGPDDCYLAQRGLRTLAVRLKHHEVAALRVAEWLAARAEVEEVRHPALPSAPGHALWKRYFTGASGLFAFVLKPFQESAVAAMVDGMQLFKMGFSWGGYESLILPFHPNSVRTATRWPHEGMAVRLAIGLEDTDDLIADLEAGFHRLTHHASR